MRRLAALSLVFLTVVLWIIPQSASADATKALRGVALVIGQSDYRNLPPIVNPARDAREIQKLLGDLGFEVKSVANLDTARLKREIDRFAEDAQGADVALLYYAGHGIEAGGDNWLVPVDADLSALDAMSQTLAPMSKLLDRLAASVPVSIVMFDACRTDPFPPGALARTEDGKKVPVSSAGLGLPRGARSLTTDDAVKDGTGVVVGFAASPGMAALDGVPDGNSPYAAAIIKHLGAGGYDFADVMTLVSQEVYLETGGRQTPWLNTGLRRFLYFGAAPAVGEPDAELITGERRKLLLTIASTPVDTKKLVEAAAVSEAVPLGTLYGLLAALGEKVPQDPRELDTLLRGQTERLRSIMSERDTLKSTDVEIVRLSGLADKALDEGAVDASIKFREQAKMRVALLAKAVDQVEADVKARRTEFAEVYARSADTYLFAFDQMKAATDYRKAYEEIRKWDSGLAWQYKLSEANALRTYGDFRGDNKVLQDSLKVFADAARLLPADGMSIAWAKTQNDYGLAVHGLGLRRTDQTTLQQAVNIFRGISTPTIRQMDAATWADGQANLGMALTSLGTRSSGPEQFEEATVAFRAAQEVLDKQQQPLKWANARRGEADSLSWIGLRGNQPALLAQATDAYEEVLATLTREMDPFTWAATQNSLGTALWAVGDRQDGTELLLRAVDAYTAGLSENRRDRVPLLWATGQSNLGNALSSLGQRERGTESLVRAIEAFHNALEEWTRDGQPFDWATAQNNLGRALVLLGDRAGRDDIVREGLSAYAEAEKEWTRKTAPVQWGSLRMGVASGLLVLGRLQRSVSTLQEARAAMQEAWDFYRNAGYPQYNGFFQDRLTEIDRAIASIQ